MLPDTFEKYIAAGAVDTTASMLTTLSCDKSEHVRRRVAENSRTPAECLALLGLDQSSAVRIAVSENPTTPGHIIASLVRDEDPDVRYAMAENAQLEPSILEQLLLDDNPYVAGRARSTLSRLHDHSIMPTARVEVESTLTQSQQLHVLLIEDSSADAKLLRQILAASPHRNIEVTWVTRLAEGMSHLKTSSFDVVLLDLGLPDSQGIDTFRFVHTLHPTVPIIVLTGLDDEASAFVAVSAGAQDYLVKGQIPGGLLIRAIQYAIERNSANEKIKQLNVALEDRVIQLASANRELEEAGRLSQLSRDQALQASNFKSQFLAKMSHEIRTPIAALISVIELLKEGGSAAEQNELLRMGDESAHCLLDVINDVLDLSKIEAGKFELQLTDFSPCALVEEVGDLFVPAARKKNVKIMTFVDPAIPAIVECDPVRLKQVLLNFVGNAVKFTDHGEILLRAKLESEDQETVDLRFSVIDTGCGIAEGLIGQLFQPFVQVGKGQAHGTGLGLSICKRLVELMGGQIGVQSIEGKGSTFWFCLRLNRSKKDPTTRPFHLTHARNLLQPSRVLVVADTQTVRDILHDYICAAGLRNGTAASAEEALSMIRRADQIEDRYQLALVDLSPSKARSFAFELSEDPSISSTLLLYIADASEASGYGAKAWEAGFSGYLQKPVRQAELINSIVELLSTNLPGESHLTEQLSEGSSVQAALSSTVKQVNVLLAEDNEVIRKVLVAQLSTLGIVVTATGNGKEVVQAFSQGPYSLVLMDISMPEMNGLEAARAIRRIESSTNHHTPIVALTARTMSGDREECFAAGMDDYLAKPVTLAQLQQVLQRWTSLGISCEVKGA